jgi:hypothetical protein
MPSSPDAGRELLRHTVATLAYRGGKALRGAPADFGSFRAGEGSRTPLEILAHLGDLFDWAVTIAEGRRAWRNAPPGSWESETARFFDALARFDAILAADAPLGSSIEKLFQGPVADALTHVGQITFLRRMAGSPVKGESYFESDIHAGRVGPEQPAARREFD